MKLDSGEFETEVEDGCFGITLRKTFLVSSEDRWQDKECTQWLTKQDAQGLVDELLHFIQYGK